MILSMTGYSKVEGSYNHTNHSIEIKSLNSKSLDCRVKLPSHLYDLEMNFLKKLTVLQRGKVDVFVTSEYNYLDFSKSILDENLVLSYMDVLKKLAPDSTQSERLGLSLRMPNVFLQKEKQPTDENFVDFLLDLLDQAIEKHNQFRKQEGDALRTALETANQTILEKLKLVEAIDFARKNKLRNRLYNLLEQSKIEVDKNRFEQEVIYYIEKMDITEEKVRLQNHCEYFQQQLTSPEMVGKKLGFLAQEMGREINTIGSKASDETLQRIVIEMKENLEAIKEQTMNVL